MIEQKSDNMNTQKNDYRPTVLKVDHVAKSFRLPTEQASGLKMAFLNWTKGIKGYTEQQVLRDISFEVKQGDFFGIVGRNGSGKSTLLKIISQIYVPEKGSIEVNGKLVPFIELGVGFNPELTGRENVYLNGALLGFTHSEIDTMYDDIVDFAELGDFMDQKLKNYSSGMQVRLAFSVAIKAQGDILVLDEVLAVGDEAFQRKCDSFFTNIKKDPKKTVILVTHSMESVKKYCTNAMLIKDGEIVAIGDKNDVADRYTEENMQGQDKVKKKNSSGKSYPVGLNARCPLLQATAISPLLVDGHKPFEFEIEYQFNEKGNYFFTLKLFDLKRGGIVYDSYQSLKINKLGHCKETFFLPLNLFTDGEFRLQVSIMTPNPEDPRHSKEIAHTNDKSSCLFAIRNSGYMNSYGLINDANMPIERKGLQTVSD